MSLWRLFLRNRRVAGAKSNRQMISHLRRRREFLDELRGLERERQRASGQRRRDLEARIENLRRAIIGHEKEIEQKWPGALDREPKQ